MPRQGGSQVNPNVDHPETRNRFALQWRAPCPGEPQVRVPGSFWGGMKPKENRSLEQILESAAIVFWADLMHSTPFGLLHIEYCFAPTGTLDYLRFWCSVTRGRWLLACEYRMSASISHSAGARFENGYQSDGLARILDFVMQHQNSFLCPADHGRQGLLQICTPTEEESTAAAASVKDAVDFLNSAIAEPSVA